MYRIEKTLKTPQENLALDEALLDEAEENQSSEVLRIWESPSYFVALGSSNAIQTETHFKTCQNDLIPIYRRCSGGGAVLQGPGCLNYALILNIKSRPELNGIRETNLYIMKKIQESLLPLLREIEVRGITDLAINQLKFSGNSQRRKKNFLLFHGTFLYAFDLSKISRYLAMPSKQPCYREGRPHTEFVTNIPLSRDQIQQALFQAWQANLTLDSLPQNRIRSLLESKYNQETWNERF